MVFIGREASLLSHHEDHQKSIIGSNTVYPHLTEPFNDTKNYYIVINEK